MVTNTTVKAILNKKLIQRENFCCNQLFPYLIDIKESFQESKSDQKDKSQIKFFLKFKQHG